MPTFGLRQSGLTQEELNQIQLSGTQTPDEYVAGKRREHLTLMGVSSVLAIGLFTGINKYLKR